MTYPFDARAARRALARDRELAVLMRKVGPFRMEMKPPRTTFTALAEAIVYQQLTARAAATIFGRVEALFAARKLRAEDVVGASDAQLRSAGLSRAKAAALRDLAEKSLAGSIPTLRKLEGMDDEAIVETLTAVRGIGRWTVEMLLIFQLGRPDVLPLADYGLRKGFAGTFGGHGEVALPKAMSERAEQWRPFRTMASWYLWRALEL